VLSLAYGARDVLHRTAVVDNGVMYMNERVVRRTLSRPARRERFCKNISV